MKNLGFLFAVGLILTACGPKDAETVGVPDSASEIQALSGILRASDIDFGSYNRDLAKFVKLEIGEPMASAESNTLAYFTPKASGEGNVRFEMDKLQGYIGGQAFIATIDGLVDDSVKAEQLYAIGKKQADESFTLVDYGMRVKCWRGDNPNEWGTDLCP